MNRTRFSGMISCNLPTASAQISNTTVLSVDLMDLSALYRELFAASGHMAFNISVKENLERTRTCNFGFKSEMFRGLRLSTEVYRSLTLGIYTERVSMLPVPEKVTPLPSSNRTSTNSSRSL